MNILNSLFTSSSVEILGRSGPRGNPEKAVECVAPGDRKVPRWREGSAGKAGRRLAAQFGRPFPLPLWLPRGRPAAVVSCPRG